MIGERSEPLVVRWMESLVLHAYPYVGYVCLLTFITQRVHRRFYRLDLEKEMVVMETRPRSLDSLMI